MRLPKPGLTTQIFIALLIGAIAGVLIPSAGASLQVLATVFVRLVLVIIAPLIFSSLVVGIAGQGRPSALGTTALQTVAYFMLITGLALLLGFALALLLRPGAAFPIAGGGVTELSPPPAESFWVRLFPQSIVDAMARGDVLQIVIFSLLFGTAVTLSGEPGRRILEWCGSLAQIMFRFTDLVMKAAPLGVFGAAASLTSRGGLAAGLGFFKLIVAVYLGLGALLLLVFPLLAIGFRIPLRSLFQAIKEPFAIAFATASASAALPKSMENMESMGVPRSVVALVMPTGLSLNPAGTTLFVGVASLFLIQAYGIELGQAALIALFWSLYVVSKGVAGVPRFGLVVTAAGLTSIGMSADLIGTGMGLLLAVDPLLDMPRTAVNTTGNCLAAAIIARWRKNLATVAPPPVAPD